MDNTATFSAGLCPPHHGLAEKGHLEPLRECIACLRNQRDNIRSQLAALTEENARLRGALEQVRRELICTYEGFPAQAYLSAIETVRHTIDAALSPSPSSGVLEQVVEALEQLCVASRAVRLDNVSNAKWIEHFEATRHAEAALTSLRQLLGRQS